jgi:homoserine kinase
VSSVRVRAPASTANLGPGFDCLGAALSLALDVTVTAAPGSPNQSLVAKAFEAVAGTSEIELEIHKGFASGRGLGFSAAEVAAGVLAGCTLEGQDPDPGRLLELGLPLEGHPDNLAASLYGGLTLVLPGEQPEVVSFRPSVSVRPTILLPREKLPTSEARRVLPETVPLADAVASVARSSGLLAMLTGAADPTTERLMVCTEDVLHQPYRTPLMPATGKALEMLRGEGVAATVSGAGPSILCLITEDTQRPLEGCMQALADWERLELEWDPEGAQVIE